MNMSTVGDNLNYNVNRETGELLSDQYFKPLVWNSSP